MVVKEVDFAEALDFTRRNRTKLVWLGREPVERIRELLELDSSKLIAADPDSVVNGGKDDAAKFKDCVFVCYHGNTSRYVVNALKDKFGIDSLNLKGGVTAIVGEIF